MFQVIFFGALVLYVIVTFFVSRKESTADFNNMSGNASAILVAGTYTASIVSAIGMLGAVGVSYNKGILVGFWNWAFVSYVFGAFLGVKLRRMGGITLGDFYGARYDSKGIRVLYAGITIIALGAYYLAQIIGSAAIVEALVGMPYNYAMVLMVVVITIITIVGGTKTVTVTDTIMLGIIVIAIGYVLCPIVIEKVGFDSVREMAASHPERAMNMGGGAITWGGAIGIQFLWGCGNAVNPAFATRAYLAKDGKTWLKAAMISLFCVATLVYLMFFAAQGIWTVKSDIPTNQVLIWASRNLTNPVVGGIAIAGLFAACLSTADTQMLVLAQSIVRDVYKDGMHAGEVMDEKRLVNLQRLWMCIIAVLSIILTWSQSSMLFAIGNFGGAMFAATYTPALFFGVLWKKFNKNGATWSMVAGAGVCLLLYLVAVFQGLPFGTINHLPGKIHPVLYGLFSSLLVGIVVSLATAKSQSPRELEVFEIVTPPKAKLVRESEASRLSQ